MRLIDANELIIDILAHDISDHKRIDRIILDAPTVEAVEVVRCKDCKYLEIINKAPVYACCSKHNHTFYLFGEDTREHFCSWGERRENETD